MAGAGEATHVWAYFGQHDLGYASSNPRRRVEPLELRLKRAFTLTHLDVQSLVPLVQEVDVRQDLGDQEALMGAEASVQRALEQRQLLFHLPLVARRPCTTGLEQHVFLRARRSERFLSRSREVFLDVGRPPRSRKPRKGTDAVSIPTTMRALQQTSLNGPQDLHLISDAPVPSPGPGEALIRVTAAGVNYVDIFA
jgi:hypothetical protein